MMSVASQTSSSASAAFQSSPGQISSVESNAHNTGEQREKKLDISDSHSLLNQTQRNTYPNSLTFLPPLERVIPRTSVIKIEPEMQTRAGTSDLESGSSSGSQSYIYVLSQTSITDSHSAESATNLGSPEHEVNIIDYSSDDFSDSEYEVCIYICITLIFIIITGTPPPGESTNGLLQ